MRSISVSHWRHVLARTLIHRVIEAVGPPEDRPGSWWWVSSVAISKGDRDGGRALD